MVVFYHISHPILYITDILQYYYKNFNPQNFGILFSSQKIIFNTKTAKTTIFQKKNTKKTILKIIGIVVVIILIILAIPIIAFWSIFKELFVLKALNDNFDDVNFTPERGFEESFINKIGMLDTADRYHSNDLFSAKYKGIDFQQADIHTKERYEDNEGHVSYITRFKGRYMIFEFNKKFKANIRVTSKDFSSASLPWRKKFHEVKMEDVEFNKCFKVYAENEHDAFYILTPHFMEKLKELDNKFDADLLFGFVDNKLHIAVDNYEDSFEHNVFEEINEASIENEIIKDIKLITDFVKELNLENDLFGKEV